MDVDECASDPCQNGAVCHDMVNRWDNTSICRSFSSVASRMVLGVYLSRAQLYSFILFSKLHAVLSAQADFSII